MYPLAKNTDPITSDMAAEDLIKSGNWTNQKSMVFAALKTYVTAKDKNPTSAELAHASNLDRYMVARRLPDLEKDGQVRKTAIRKCAVTQKAAVTWETV